MNRSRIISTFRVEFRRKGASYKQERTATRWVQKFLDYSTIDHSSQIRHWQCDYFVSELRKCDHSYDDLLQAQSALQFLLKRILHLSYRDEMESNDASGIIRITAWSCLIIFWIHVSSAPRILWVYGSHFQPHNELWGYIAAISSRFGLWDRKRFWFSKRGYFFEISD